MGYQQYILLNMDSIDIYNSLDERTKNSADRQWLIELSVLILCGILASLYQNIAFREIYPFVTIKNIWLLLIIARVYVLIESIIFRVTYIIPKLRLSERYNFLVMCSHKELTAGVGIQILILSLMLWLLWR
jgi:hypothetical protein